MYIKSRPTARWRFRFWSPRRTLCGLPTLRSGWGIWKRRCPRPTKWSSISSTPKACAAPSLTLASSTTSSCATRSSAPRCSIWKSRGRSSAPSTATTKPARARAILSINYMTHTAIIKKFSIVALVFVIFCTVAPPAHAADPLSVTLSPAAAVNIGTTGTGWSASTVARALLVDGSETNLTNALPANGASMLLVLTGFNFDIPAGATIAGVAVSVTRRSTSSSGAFVRDAAIELVGGFGTSSSLATADAWPATLAAAAYGGASTLWGESLTPDDVNAANFGLAIAAQNTDPDAAHNAHVDGATVTVYYYEADTTPPSIAAAPDLPGNEATSSAGVAVSFDLPSASDEAGIASESCDPASGLTFALGTTTVTCTAADAVDGTVAGAGGGGGFVQP